MTTLLSASLSSSSEIRAAITIDEYGFLYIAIDDESREVVVDGLSVSDETVIQYELREIVIDPELVT